MNRFGGASDDVADWESWRGVRSPKIKWIFGRLEYEPHAGAELRLLALGADLQESFNWS